MILEPLIPLFSFTEIIPLLISSLFGGGIGVFLNHKLSTRKQDTSEFQILLQERKEIADEFKNSKEEMNTKLEQMQAQVSELLVKNSKDETEKAELRGEIKSLKDDITLILPMLEQVLQPYPDMQWMIEHLKNKFKQ